MSQLNKLAAMIVAAIDRVNTSIQKLGDYVTANTYEFNADAIVETIGISGALGILGIVTRIFGTIAETSDVSAVRLNTVFLIGELVGASGVDGNLTGIWTNRGFVAGISGMDGSLDSQFGCTSSAAGISGVLATLRNATTELIGSCSAGSNVSGVELQ